MKILNFVIVGLISTLLFCRHPEFQPLNNDKPKVEVAKICNCVDPKTELKWLKDFIALSDRLNTKPYKDSTYHYFGSIYFEKYGIKDAFLIDMQLFNSGLDGHWFDCDGKKIELVRSDTIMPRLYNKLIYTNKK